MLTHVPVYLGPMLHMLNLRSMSKCWNTTLKCNALANFSITPWLHVTLNIKRRRDNVHVCTEIYIYNYRLQKSIFGWLIGTRKPQITLRLPAKRGLPRITHDLLFSHYLLQRNRGPFPLPGLSKRAFIVETPTLLCIKPVK